MDIPKFSRRTVLRNGALMAAADALGRTAYPMELCDERGTVQDRLWLWGHYEGSHNSGWNLPGTSRITPIEAACYLSIPNTVMVEYNGMPKPPWDQYVVPFRAMHRVVWSVVAAGGVTSPASLDAALHLAENNPNFVGVIMDDFFGGGHGTKPALSIQSLENLRTRLRSGPRKLDLWVTLYTHDLNNVNRKPLSYCDVVTLWTWNAPDLKDLAVNFKKAEELSPTTRKILGCYMWDYGNKRPMPISAMQRQSEQGLEWLHEGRIDGMIFLASCICDLNLEAVEWTRNWIRKVGSKRLAKKRWPSGGGA